MDFSTGIIFGMIAMTGFGISNALIKFPVSRYGSIKTSLYRNFFIVGLLLIVLPFFWSSFEFNLKYMMFALIISVAGFISLVLFVKALGMGKVGVISPISGTSVVFTAIISVLFFNDVLSVIQIIAIGVITMGVILVSLNFTDLRKSNLFKLSSGIPYALIVSVIFGVNTALIKYPIDELGPLLTSFIVEAGVLICAFIAVLMIDRKISLPQRDMTKYVFLIALTAVAGGLGLSVGISVTSVSVVAALSAASPMVSTVYGRVVYKEKLNFQQYLAISLIIAGVVILAIV